MPLFGDNIRYYKYLFISLQRKFINTSFTKSFNYSQQFILNTQLIQFYSYRTHVVDRRNEFDLTLMPDAI